jgi:hypothetical protein
MRLRQHRQNLVVFGPAGTPAPARSRRILVRIRRLIRMGGLLVVIGLIRVSSAVRPRWRPLLAGTALTVAGVMMRTGSGGVLLMPGLLFLVYALLIPPSLETAQRSELERELAAYSTPAQRRDLEAILDQYPDTLTFELRHILASQPTATGDTHLPAAGRY